MTRGLVQRRVDAHHEVEVVESFCEVCRIGCGQHRVASDGDQGAHLTLAGGEDLLGHGSHGEFAVGLGVRADPAVPPTNRVTAAARRWPARSVGRSRPHGPSRTVEVAGENVQQIGRPCGQRAELRRVGADAAVHDAGGSSHQLLGHAHDHLGVDPRHRGYPIHRERVDRCGHPIESFGVLLDRFGAGPTLHHQTGQGEQQHGVGPGTDEHVFRSSPGGLGPPGVDHDHLAAPVEDRLQAAREVGSGAEAAVGLQGVGSEYQEVVRSVEIGHRYGQRAAEHETG